VYIQYLTQSQSIPSIVSLSNDELLLISLDWPHPPGNSLDRDEAMIPNPISVLLGAASEPKVGKEEVLLLVENVEALVPVESALICVSCGAKKEELALLNEVNELVAAPNIVLVFCNDM
jgi:hypothetical protein